MSEISIAGLLKTLAEWGGSDLHIGAGTPPIIRVCEKLQKVGTVPLNDEDARALIYALLTQDQIETFERDHELDFSYEVEALGRFRVNVFVQRSLIASSIRLIPYHIMGFKECGLPEPTMKALCKKPKGLVLITGATGSGKSTTLAAMIDFINQERACHIVTIEDPIEFVHHNRSALIDQREVYHDTHTFAIALKHVLRQDPDVIMIGEMRDLETIETALICAETGHLVIATLHTTDAVQTINRIVDVFPAYQQQQIKTQLSFVLIAIISQQLIPRANGPGRVLATEMLVANSGVRSMIRESKTHQMISCIQTGHKEGMYTMNQSLHDLCERGDITYDDAVARSLDPEDLNRLFKK
ncbi:MAG: type IV pilus twitching motility protein PilT [Candidatus Omnitrophota bacterium]